MRAGGAGPGRAGLLTPPRKDLQQIQQASLVVSGAVGFRRCASADLLFLRTPRCGRVFRRQNARGYHCMQEINGSAAGSFKGLKTLVRLKGGVHLLFLLAMVAEGWETHSTARCSFLRWFRGAAAASGCSPIPGIPLTHRSVCMLQAYSNYRTTA